MNTFYKMLKTELKLSLRGMDMVIFAICMPLVVLVILGIIYNNQPAFEGAEYSFIEQSFGALISISICAGGVMGLPLIISEYRSKKILKRLKVTPVSPIIILVVQVAVYVLYALGSLISIYFTAKYLFGYQLRGSWLNLLGSYLLVMLCIFSIGMMIGGISPNTKIAGVVASVVYFPMLIFSGATLPYEVMPLTVKRIADILPLTQGIKLLKSASLGGTIDNMLIPIIVMILLAIVCISISIKFFKWE